MFSRIPVRAALILAMLNLLGAGVQASVVPVPSGPDVPSSTLASQLSGIRLNVYYGFGSR